MMQYKISFLFFGQTYKLGLSQLRLEEDQSLLRRADHCSLLANRQLVIRVELPLTSTANI